MRCTVKTDFGIVKFNQTFGQVERLVRIFLVNLFLKRLYGVAVIKTVTLYGRVEQWQLARLITLRLAVQIRPLQPWGIDTPFFLPFSLPDMANERNTDSRERPTAVKFRVS